MELRKQRINMITALAFLGICAAAWFWIIPEQIKLNALWGGSSGVNSRTVPFFATAIVALSAVGELLQSGVRYLKLKKENAKLEKKPVEWKAEGRAALIFLLCLAYAVLFSTLGYIAATIIVPPIMLFLLGNRNIKHYIAVYAVGALMYVVFIYLLNIPLP